MAGYVLGLLAVVLPFTHLIMLVIAYVKRGDSKGTYLEGHFRWQIRTFWFSLLWAVLGLFLLFFGVGILVLIAAGIWDIYRMIKGLLKLNDGVDVYGGASS